MQNIRITSLTHSLVIHILQSTQKKYNFIKDSIKDVL